VGHNSHRGNWSKQIKAGRPLLAGGMNGDYWDSVALIIFEAVSEEEAETVVKKDPAVTAHVFRTQVRPMDVHWLTNKFQPGAETC
jgi:uncharacterized protein YciI